MGIDNTNIDICVVEKSLVVVISFVYCDPIGCTLLWVTEHLMYFYSFIVLCLNVNLWN